MQVQELTYLLQHPESITSLQTEQLATLVDQYPYCQPLHALFLKGLKQKESFKYNNALKITAAHTADRSVLFDYITSEVFNQNEISTAIKQNSEHIKAIAVSEPNDISVNKSVTIDDKLKEHIKATEGVLDPHLFKVKPEPVSDVEAPKIEDSIIEVDVDNITAKEKLEIGKPLEFDKNENHSFSEWLKLTNFLPIARDNTKEDQQDEIESKTFVEKPEEESTADVKQPLENKLDLIDKFISENPKIKPVASHTPKPKLVNNDDTISENLMTETLARIYLEQKNYDKAIQSYKILSLKYPEKSSFFADRIKSVQELKDHNTK